VDLAVNILINPQHYVQYWLIACHGTFSRVPNSPLIIVVSALWRNTTSVSLGFKPYVYIMGCLRCFKLEKTYLMIVRSLCFGCRDQSVCLWIPCFLDQVANFLQLRAVDSNFVWGAIADQPKLLKSAYILPHRKKSGKYFVNSPIVRV
jgi:hypothetical protein